MVFSLYKSRNLSPCQKCRTYGNFGRPLQIIFSVFVRGVIWHQAEGYNCNIMSQILSFLTHVTALPVGSISSSHTKISAIYWYHYLVWVLIPLDGAAIDGVMLSIVLYLRRTFLARLFNHICIHFRDDIAIIPLLVPNFSSYKECYKLSHLPMTGIRWNMHSHLVFYYIFPPEFEISQFLGWIKSPWRSRGDFIQPKNCKISNSGGNI